MVWDTAMLNNQKDEEVQIWLGLTNLTKRQPSLQMMSTEYPLLEQFHSKQTSADVSRLF